MQRIIMNPFCAIPHNEASHTFGWVRNWAQLLSDDMSNCNIHDNESYITCLDGEILNSGGAIFADEIYIDFGPYFDGTINLFEGIDEDIYWRLQNLVDFVEDGGDVRTLNITGISLNIGNFLTKRKDNESTKVEMTDEWIASVADVFNKATCTDMVFMERRHQKIAIGDTHALAMLPDAYPVIMKPRQTLRSALDKGLFTLIGSAIPDLSPTKLRLIKTIILSLGSEDIRHDVFSEGAAYIEPEELADNYVEAVFNLVNEYRINIIIAAPVPIEHEDRNVAKVSLGKNGKAFSGSREDRLNYTLRFITALVDNFQGIEVIVAPVDWYLMDGETYAKDIMEIGRGVHIGAHRYNSQIKYANNPWDSSVLDI